MLLDTLADSLHVTSTTHELSALQKQCDALTAGPGAEARDKCLGHAAKISSTLCDSGLRDRATALRQEIARREQDFTGLDRALRQQHLESKCDAKMALPRLLREAPDEDLGDCLSRDGFRNPVSIGARTTACDRPADIGRTDIFAAGDAIIRPCVEMECGIVPAGEVVGKCENRESMNVGEDMLKEIALAKLERERAIEMKRACDKRVEELQAAVDALSVIRSKLRSELCRMQECTDEQQHIVHDVTDEQQHKINLDELD